MTAHAFAIPLQGLRIFVGGVPAPDTPRPEPCARAGSRGFVGFRKGKNPSRRHLAGGSYPASTHCARYGLR